MLRKQYRLRKKYQFNYVYRVGKTCYGKFVLLAYSKSKNKNVKIGISVSKKVGNAVKRNRARRLIREAVSLYLDQIKIDYNLIFVAKQSIEGKKLEDIRADILDVLSRAELLK